MRLSGRSLRWLLPVLLILVTAAQMAAQDAPGNVVSADSTPSYIADLTEKAEAGDVKAQYSLGIAYTWKGSNNPEESKRWYSKAASSYRVMAERGDAPSQYALGTMYDQGKGVMQDHTEALRWFRKAATQGYADAQSLLGFRYERGMFVPQDHAEALRWYRKAAAQGDAAAKTYIASIAEAGKREQPPSQQQAAEHHLATASISSDRLALEPALMKEEGYACSSEPNANESDNEIADRKAALDFCRAKFLNDIKYKRLRLGLNGTTGVLVQLPEYRPFCTAAHCEMVLLKPGGRKYFELLHQQSGHIDDYVVEKTSTNGYYDIEQNSKYEAAKKFVWDGSKYLAEQELEALRQKGHAEQRNATAQARVATEQSVAKSQAAVVSALPDGDARAAARRQYASTLEGAMVRTLRNDQDVDPTLVSLRVYTTTPQTNDGSKTRDDFRLIVETNSIALPRDVVALLRKPMLNSDLYKLGFRALRFQDTVGDQTGSILCDVSLKPEGAHPAFCMKIEERFVPDNNKYNNDAGYWGYRASDWTPYHQWPKDYIVH